MSSSFGPPHPYPQPPGWGVVGKSPSLPPVTPSIAEQLCPGGGLLTSQLGGSRGGRGAGRRGGQDPSWTFLLGLQQICCPSSLQGEVPFPSPDPYPPSRVPPPPPQDPPSQSCSSPRWLGGQGWG